MKSARTLAIWAGLLLLGFAPAFSRDAGPGRALVEAVRSGLIEVEPQTSFTAVFRVKNKTALAHEYSGKAELPDGWRLVMEEPAFKLAPGAETIRLVSIFVPLRALAGTYKIGYTIETSGERASASRAGAAVKVMFKPRLGVQAMDVTPFVIAGETCTSRFLIMNQGNAPLEVSLSVSSNGYRVVPGAKSLHLEAGQSEPIDITVQTDAGIRKKLSQNVELTAEAIVPKKGTLLARAMTQQDVIPRVYGKDDYFNRLPLEIGLETLVSNTGQRYVQFKISGSGALDKEGKQQIDLLFRGPGRDDFNLFGLQREEYRFKYDSPHVNLQVGDKSFSLTSLTEFGVYGRGIEAGFNAGRFSLRGYHERNLFVGSRRDETAFQLGFSPFDKMKVNVNYLTQTEPARQASRIFSVQSQLQSDVANVDLEYSWDATTSRDLRPANSALRLDVGGRFEIVTYRANVIRSGSDYSGYYRNLNYNSGELTLTPWTRLQIRASYLDQRRTTAILPFFLPFYDRTLLAGFQYQLLKWMNFSVEQRTHDRMDLSPDAQFHYRDSTLRLGALANFGSISFQNFVDVGKTYNELTRKYDKLVEYTLSTNVTIIDKLTLGGYLHYRDQDASFTGEGERRLDLNLTAGLALGRLNVDAFYRTALHEELYRSALSEKSFENPAFLLNNYDMFGVSLTQRFGNGHQLSLRVQRAVNPFGAGLPADRFVALAEYSIPLGFPIGRKSDIGRLRGTVYDAENGRKGVEGVVVKINDLAAVTDANGMYVFNALEPGHYALTLQERVAKHDRITVQKTPLDVMVAGGKTIDCPIGLTAGSSLAGRIMVYKFERAEPELIARKAPARRGPSIDESAEKAGPESPKPRLVESAVLTAVSVELRDAGGEAIRAMTDEDGRFVFDGLRPGSYTLKVYDDRLPELHVFEQDTFTCELKPGAREQVEIRVVPVVRPIQIIKQGEVTIKKKKID